MRFTRLFGLVCAVGLGLAVTPVASQPPMPPMPPAKKPTVDEEIKVPVNQIVTIAVRAVGSVEGGIGFKATFDVAPKGPHFSYWNYKDGEHRFQFQSVKPGRYTIVFWVKGEIDGVVTTVVVGDVKDDKTEPDPDTEITPSKKPLARLVLVTDATPGQSAVRTPYLTGTFPEDFKALGFDKDVPSNLDKGDVGPGGRPLSERAQELLKRSDGKKLPQFFVLARDDTIVLQGDLPEKPSDLIKKLKQLKGK